jgi:peptide/nickel transport system ATP-binding protein
MSSILEITNLIVRYKIKNKEIHAVEDVSLSVNKEEFVGIVGESGSGKSTMAHAIVKLLPPNAYIKNGKVNLLGYDLTNMTDEEVMKVRWKDFSIVFQKSMSALSPVHRIDDQMMEAIKLHNPQISQQDIESRLNKLLQMVNLPKRVLKSYPHELSGGMMQRVMIALALVNFPKFVIFDEATTALDVVTQGQIIEEIRQLVKELSLTGMVITHDIGVVNELCDKIAVMYAGKLVEYGSKSDIIHNPYHPYTKALISSLPDFMKERGEFAGIPGNLPDLSQPPKGCIFAPRCPLGDEKCFEQVPPLLKNDDRQVACFKVKEVKA